MERLRVLGYFAAGPAIPALLLVFTATAALVVDIPTLTWGAIGGLVGYSLSGSV